MHELRRNGPPVVAVPGQAKRHQQHSVHKVGFKIFKCLKFKYFSAITKNLQRCGGAGHTTGDCMVNFHFFLHQCQVSANAKTDLKSANLFRLVDLGIKYLLAQDQELSPPTSGAHLDRWVRYPCLFFPNLVIFFFKHKKTHTSCFLNFQCGNLTALFILSAGQGV